MKCLEKRRDARMEPENEQGFMLVGLIVAIFFILLALTVAAPKVAEGLRREREVEAVHRGNQYVRAIRLYHKKTGMFPGSLEQLEKTNNIRYLRQQYVDPMTGKVDWKLIHVGEAKTTVKGFFGQPLAGLAQGSGLGSAAGMASPGMGGNSAAGASSFSSTFGSSSQGGSAGSGLPTLGGSTTSGPGTTGSSSPGASGTGTSETGATGQSTGSGSTLGSAAGIASSSGMPSGGAPFVGVGIPKDGDSITVLNEQTTYDTWEFIYDPRIEQLYAKGSLFGGSSTLGSAGGSSGFGNTPGSGNTPGAPGLGNSPGFGNTPNGPGSPSPGAPTTPTTPQ
jgi:type II secretory pathway pseudopilin PulG